MKATKYLAMAAAALAFAACSNEELASTQNNKNGLKPLEFSTIVQKQTRAQITSANLTTLYMETTGTFYDANNVKVINPTLTLTKSGSDWTYTYNNNTEPSDLYWPLEGTNATFKAWYYEGGSAAGAFNDKTAEKDAVGAYTAINYVSGEQTVSLSMYHAVAKAEFKVKVLEKEQGNNKVKIDVKRVCLHNMNYQASAYTTPTSEALMGAFTVDGNTHRDLLTPLGDTPSFITEGTDAVNKGSLFVLPQTFTVQDLTETTWSKPYISVLAQICIDEDGDNDPVVYPKNGTATDYAWIALPLPSEFTGMVAHKKYVFTINFRNDALGKVDRDQNPNGEDGNGEGEEPNEDGDDDEEEPSGPNTNDNVPNGDEGTDIVLANHSGFPLIVTVEEVEDFDEGGDYNVSNNTPAPAPEEDFVTFSDGTNTVKVATKNLGATTVAESAATSYGDYYAWGATETFGTVSYTAYDAGTVTATTGHEGGYTQANAPYYSGSAYTKYTSSSDATLEAADDAVAANMPGYHMPTRAELQTLFNACGGTGEIMSPSSISNGAAYAKGIYWVAGATSAVTIGGDTYSVNGVLFVQDADTHVFFPAAGKVDGTDLNAGSGGYYWSSSLYTDYTKEAYYLNFLSFIVNPGGDFDRYYGFPVRPFKD